jgi:hypothetical protein
MNIKSDTWIGKKGFRFWYYRFRDSEYYSLTIIGVAILVCIYLIFNIIIPEVTHWFSIQDEVTATRSRISVLQQNINFVTNLDKNTLNNQLQIVSHALPPQKNFGAIVNTISNSAANSGVALNDYAFQVGDLSGSTTGPRSGIQQNGLPVIDITIVVNGNLNDVKKFIQSIERSLPIAQVTTINGTGENVSLKIQFYQKPFPKVTFTGDTPLEGLSPKKVELLQTIAKWDKSTTAPHPASSSKPSGQAVPLF